jgi:hypothetical protein
VVPEQGLEEEQQRKRVQVVGGVRDCFVGLKVEAERLQGIRRGEDPDIMQNDLCGLAEEDWVCVLAGGCG